MLGVVDDRLAVEQIGAVGLPCSIVKDHAIAAFKFGGAAVPVSKVCYGSLFTVNVGRKGCSLSLFGNKRNEAGYHAKAQQQ